MKNTMIISAFAGCGKTYLHENQGRLKFCCNGQEKSFVFHDADSSQYAKCEHWEKQYVDALEKQLGTVDFLLISQHDGVLAELEARDIPFVIVAPDNSPWLSDEERLLIKQQWFGRLVLRDNSHIKDVGSWLGLLKDNYDKWTSWENLKKHHPAAVFVLKDHQYMGDIVADLEWRRGRYADRFVAQPTAAVEEAAKLKQIINEPLTFQNGDALYRYLKSGHDLYNPTTGRYLFLYNDAGAVCAYNFSEADAKKLAAQAVKEKTFWSSLLGAGGTINRYGIVFIEGKELHVFCEGEAKKNGFYDTEQYEAMQGYSRNDDRFWAQAMKQDMDNIMDDMMER